VVIVNFFAGFGLMMFILFSSCTQEKAQILPPTEAEKAEISPIGQQAANVMLKTLQSELMAAIEKKGVMGAITICNERALKLTDSLTQNLARVTKIKRSSLKSRNPLNEPDSYEQEALMYYNADSKRMKEVYFQKIIDESGTHFRYYKPLTIKPLCVYCHGPADKLAPDLAGKLKEFYPDDKATGYKIGDFRGVVRVSVQ
jgi:hypothetical protein